MPFNDRRGAFRVPSLYAYFRRKFRPGSDGDWVKSFSSVPRRAFWHPRFPCRPDHRMKAGERPCPRSVNFKAAARRLKKSPFYGEKIPVPPAAMPRAAGPDAPTEVRPAAVVEADIALSLPGLGAPVPAFWRSILPFLLAALVALCLFGYPFFGEIITATYQSAASDNYQEVVDDIPSDEVKRLVAAAQDYNERLYAARGGTTEGLTTPEALGYYDTLSIPGTDGVMCQIVIPSVDISLPVYHGTSDAVLSEGVGHLDTSSLPVGGPSTHAVVSAHNGLPGAKMFDDLDQVQIGDEVHIKILDLTLNYRVYDIQTVLPADTSLMTIEEGKDLLSLITCTPTGINSHRLIVMCERIDDDVQTLDHNTYEEARAPFSLWTAGILIAALLLSQGLVLWSVWRACRERYRWIISRPCQFRIYALEVSDELRLSVAAEEALGLRSSLVDWLRPEDANDRKTPPPPCYLFRPRRRL